MEKSKQYLRYKDSFKKQCILEAIVSACALLTILLLIFLPCFRIHIKRNSGGEELTLADKDFSLFDEIKLCFDNVFNLDFSGSGPELILSVWYIFQIFACIYLVIGFVMLCVSCVKSILNISNLENYSLSAYVDIKSNADKSRNNMLRRFHATNFFIGGTVLELVYIIFIRIFSNIFMDNWVGVSFHNGYFIYMTGVTGAIAPVVIGFVAFIVIKVLVKKIKSKLKMDILKEDYGLQEGTPESSESGRTIENVLFKGI